MVLVDRVEFGEGDVTAGLGVLDGARRIRGDQLRIGCEVEGYAKGA